jgi:hypothetical protein
MKAFVYKGPGLKAVEDRPKPTIQAPGDAIIKIVKTTICGTDLHILKGDVPTCAPGRIIANIGVHGRKVELHLERLWLQNIAITTRLVDTATTPMVLKTVLAKKSAQLD